MATIATVSLLVSDYTVCSSTYHVFHPPPRPDSQINASGSLINFTENCKRECIAPFLSDCLKVPRSTCHLPFLLHLDLPDTPSLSP